MERTKFKSHNDSEPLEVSYNALEEPIIISIPLFDLFKKQKNFGDLYLLYSFYYYTAKWQRTNQPKATAAFVSKGIGWGIDKVQARKKELKELGLIKDIQRVNKKGKINGSYIHVNFIWSKDAINALKNPEPQNSSGGLSPVTGNSRYRQKTVPNPLSLTNNINALNTGISGRQEFFNDSLSIPIKERKNAKYLPLAEYLSKIIRSSINIKHTPYQIETWTDDFRKLEDMDGVLFSRIKIVLDWYQIHVGEDFVPIIESGKSLRQKFPKLESAILRDKRSKQPNKTQTPPNTIGSRRFGQTVDYNKTPITKY